MFSMVSGFKYRILVADSDQQSRAEVGDALAREGHVVISVDDGFAALAELTGSVPEVVIADLELPRMSGFELLAIVRRRFPAVGVIARSLEFFPAGMPEGI